MWFSLIYTADLDRTASHGTCRAANCRVCVAHLRLCNKCTLNAIGDELHVLTECNNVTLTKLRTKFYVKLLSISPQLKLLTSKSLLSYILSMCDVSICHVVIKFFFEVLKIY